MRRGLFFVAGSAWLLAFSLGVSTAWAGAPAGYTLTKMDPNKSKTWLSQWDAGIVGEYSGYRTCDWAVGEDTAWIISPLLKGYYYGYEATGDANWVAREVNWADSWFKRRVTEPDGFAGWPSYNSAGTGNDGNLNQYYADSMLGDAMCLGPIVQVAKIILSTPSLDAKYDANAKAYLALANQMYAKWQSRGGWRDTGGGGAISVVQPWGIADPTLPSSQWTWTSKYPARKDPNWGFSHPNNKANEVGMWLLSMYDTTGDANYKTQATKWYTLFKSRLTPQADGTYAIWNYWQPAGTWDYDPNGHVAKHWIGVHPNNGYYQMDTESIVDAYEHGIIFTLADIQRLVATNLGMVISDPNLLWPALAPYNQTLQSTYERLTVPDSWGGYSSAPWYLSIQAQYAVAGPLPQSSWALVSGVWADSNRWSAGVPGGAVQALVNNSGTASISGGVAKCSSLVLGLNPGDVGSLRMTSGRLEANQVTVGQGGAGAFYLLGGTGVFRSVLAIARDSSTTCGFWLTDGNLVVPRITIGAHGSMTLTRGTLRGDAADANLLSSVDSSGLLELVSGTFRLASIEAPDPNVRAGTLKIDAGATLWVGELNQSQLIVTGTLILDSSLLATEAPAGPLAIGGDITPAGDTVPEPASLALLMFGAAALLRQGRRRRSARG